MEMLEKRLHFKEKWALNKHQSFIILNLLENPSTAEKVKKDLLPHLSKLDSKKKGTRNQTNCCKFDWKINPEKNK